MNVCENCGQPCSGRWCLDCLLPVRTLHMLNTLGRLRSEDLTLAAQELRERQHDAKPTDTPTMPLIQQIEFDASVAERALKVLAYQMPKLDGRKEMEWLGRDSVKALVELASTCLAGLAWLQAEGAQL